MRLPIQLLAYIYYLDENNEPIFLMLKRKADKGNFWQGVSGGLEEGETLREGILREIKEETQIENIKSIKQIPNIYQFHSDGKWLTEYVFKVELIEQVNPKLSHEHTKYQWSTTKEANELLKYETNKDALQKLRELIQ